MYILHLTMKTSTRKILISSKTRTRHNPELLRVKHQQRLVYTTHQQKKKHKHKQKQKQKTKNKTPDHGREYGNIQWISKPPTYFPTPAVPLLNFRPFPSRSAALWTVPEVMHCTTYTFCSHKYTPPQISLRAATRVHQPCPCRDSHPGQRNCESSPAGHSTHCRRQAAPPLSNAGLDDTPKCASSRGSGSTAPLCHSLINLHHMVLLPTS